MTRDEAILLAKSEAVEFVKNNTEPLLPSQGYLLGAEHPAWKPHEWVVNAILKAANERQ
jgi:hypothetical protein